MVLNKIAGMLAAKCEFYFDDEVRDQIFGLIRDAKEWLYLVSPYNKHPQQLRDRLGEAIARGVQVTILYRDEKDQPGEVAYLERLGADAFPVKWLHSKIYINESTALASSMNLLDSSFNNSSEFCIRIDRANANFSRLYNELAEYVGSILLRGEQAVGATGHCIRCGKEVPLNLKDPFCLPDRKVWDRHKNPHYPEKYCHRCGEKHNTSMARPRCLSCWRAGVQA